MRSSGVHPSVDRSGALFRPFRLAMPSSENKTATSGRFTQRAHSMHNVHYTHCPLLSTVQTVPTRKRS